MRKSLFLRYGLAVIGPLVIAACNPSSSAIDEVYLADETPFGFTWNEIRETPEITSESDCAELIDAVSPLIDGSMKDEVFSKCLWEEILTVYMPIDKTPLPFQDGEVSMTLLGGNTPVQYTYHFLHDWRADKGGNKRRARHARAAEIKAQLIKRYGPPNTNGHFDQGTSFGYVVDDEAYQPCSFWRLNRSAILLCSTRVVMIDGTEMSLSFITLDENIIGKDARNMILAASGEPPEIETTTAKAPMPPRHFKEDLKKLAKLIYSDNLTACHKSELEPLEDFWKRTESFQAVFEETHKTYSADDLADYVFENSVDFETIFPQLDPDIAIMLLLKRAAEQGSASAMNEIGAAQLYCYQGIQ